MPSHGPQSFTTPTRRAAQSQYIGNGTGLQPASNQQSTPRLVETGQPMSSIAAFCHRGGFHGLSHDDQMEMMRAIPALMPFVGLNSQGSAAVCPANLLAPVDGGSRPYHGPGAYGKGSAVRPLATMPPPAPILPSGVGPSVLQFGPLRTPPADHASIGGLRPAHAEQSRLATSHINQLPRRQSQTTPHGTDSPTNFTLPRYRRNAANLPTGTLAPTFNSAAEAEAAERPRARPTHTASAIQLFRTRQREHVSRIMNALDSDEHSGVPPRLGDRDPWNAVERERWQMWHDRADYITRKILGGKNGRRANEARSWEVYEEIVKTHREGIREDLSHGNPTLTPADRLDDVINHLRAYPILRKAALQGIDVEEFVSNPSHYAQEKLEWKRSNLNRDLSGSKGLSNGPGPKAGGQKKRSRGDAQHKESDELEVTSQSPRVPKKARTSKASDAEREPSSTTTTSNDNPQDSTHPGATYQRLPSTPVTSDTNDQSHRQGLTSFQLPNSAQLNSGSISFSGTESLGESATNSVRGHPYGDNISSGAYGHSQDSQENPSMPASSYLSSNIQQEPSGNPGSMLPAEAVGGG